MNNYADVDKYPMIGITGKAGAGKDTFADFLFAELALSGYTQYSFAQPIKDMLLAGLGIKDKDPKTISFYGYSYRRIIQTLGTEWGRCTIGKNLWLNIARHRCPHNKVIISDVRFENEAEWVRDNGVLVHIVRDKEDIPEAGHSSEGGIGSYREDFLVENTKDLEYLEEQAKKLASYIIDDIITSPRADREERQKTMLDNREQLEKRQIDMLDAQMKILGEEL